MITVIPAHARYHADHGWLKTSHLFSFADYYDPTNSNFGVLRVFNDDYIEGNNGFPPHHHANFEIVTIVLDGAVTHEDSMGNRKTVGAGEVQSMSAGTGVMHAEMNEGDNLLHLYQLWFLPKARNIIPNYHQISIRAPKQINSLVMAAGNKEDPEVAYIHTDANVYIGTVHEETTTTYDTEKHRGVLIYVTTGKISVNQKPVNTNDQARIIREQSITIQGIVDSTYILIDVAMAND